MKSTHFQASPRRIDCEFTCALTFHKGRFPQNADCTHLPARIPARRNTNRGRRRLTELPPFPKRSKFAILGNGGRVSTKTTPRRYVMLDLPEFVPCFPTRTRPKRNRAYPSRPHTLGASLGHLESVDAVVTPTPHAASCRKSGAKTRRFTVRGRSRTQTMQFRTFHSDLAQQNPRSQVSN